MKETIYRVYTNEPTNYIDNKIMIKVFNDKIKAKKYYNELNKMVKELSKNTDDTLYVIMEDVNIDLIINSKYYNN
jgi:hypothetical protein